MRLGLRETIFALILMSIPVGAWWFVFRPRKAHDVEMLKQVELRRAKLQNLNKATGTIGDLKKEVASLTKAIAFFQSKLPSEKEIDKVLKELWIPAEANRLITKSIRTLERASEKSFTSPGGPYAEQPIAMQLEGDFRGFYAFLQAMENQPRIMRIHRMTLKKPDKGPEGRLQATFVMSIFFERSDKD